MESSYVHLCRNMLDYLNQAIRKMYPTNTSFLLELAKCGMLKLELYKIKLT